MPGLGDGIHAKLPGCNDGIHAKDDAYTQSLHKDDARMAYTQSIRPHCCKFAFFCFSALHCTPPLSALLLLPRCEAITATAWAGDSDANESKRGRSFLLVGVAQLRCGARAWLLSSCFSLLLRSCLHDALLAGSDSWLFTAHFLQ